MRPVISYYKECYLADRNHGFVTNVFQKGVSHLHFMDSEEELLCAPLGYVYFSDKNAETLQKNVYLHRREKEFLYGAMFVVGYLETTDGKPEEICAPLFFIPITIEKEDDLFVIKPDSGVPRFNYPLLAHLQKATDSHTKGDGLDEGDIDTIEDMLADGILESGEVNQLATILKTRIADMDTLDSAMYPALFSKKQVKEKMKSQKAANPPSLALVPASCIGLFKRGSFATGIALDMDELAMAPCLSAPLGSLLNLPVPPLSPNRPGGLVPAVLSNAQRQILEGMFTKRNLTIIGPPGTGKSYTVATLAMNYLSRGKSVLITSGRDQSVDVLGEKIRAQLNIQECIVRGGAKGHLTRLKKFLQNLQSGMYACSPEMKAEAAATKKTVAQLTRQCKVLEKKVGAHIAHEVKNHRRMSPNGAGIFHRLKAWISRIRLGRRVPLWDLLDMYLQTQDELVTASRLSISLQHQLDLERAIKEYRPEIVQFQKALSAKTGSRRLALLEQININRLLSVFPVWLVKLADLHRIFPMKMEMFDLVIIDEATQCDIASCLPIIQRARQVVITGDPHQLRHVSFLSDRKMKDLLAVHGLSYSDELNYRNQSILDLYSAHMSAEDSVVFLNEHYRSHPDIIRFSNHHFYHDKLKVMTERGPLQNPGALHLIQCGGIRTSKGINQTEIDKIIQHVVQIISEENVPPVSIGILSPFRNQVDAISAALNDVLSFTEMKVHRMLIGTAHEFQGEERDIMLVSLTVDNDTHGNVLRFLQRPDVFNVSITRAKQQQHVYYSISASTLSGGSLLAQYLHQHTNAPCPLAPVTPNADAAFAKAVQKELVRSGLIVQLQQRVAGIPVDMVVTLADKLLCIVLTGIHHTRPHDVSLDHYRTLHRAGIKILPLPWSKWKNAPAECIEAVKSRILQESKTGQ